MIGQRISHYKILEKLGEGGMGVVYKAHDTKLDRIVALKFLPHHLTVHEAEQARFLQEAKAASALNHPNICTIYYLEEVSGERFIVMEFVEGVTLRQKLPVQKLQEVLTYAIQIGDALQEAHAKGIVHRDIKCENIMVNAKNQIKVMDFGLAKLKGSMKLTKTSSTVGTLAYMAPEQIQGGEVDARSDIFSFGIVLFEMLTGRLPFRGEHEVAMMYSIVNEEPASVQSHRSDTPSELAHVISRAIEKNPDDRYQAMSEIVGELRHLEKKTSRVSRIMPEQAQGVSPEMKAPVSAPVPTIERKFLSPKRIQTIGGVVVGLGLVAFVLYKLFEHSTPETQVPKPFQGMKVTRLTSTGKVTDAAISPDGKYAVYVVADTGMQSLWVRQIATASNVQILPPAQDTRLADLTFSHDGNYVYYSKSERGNLLSPLYQIPALGGTPKKLIEDISSKVTLSPDGAEVAFTRHLLSSGEAQLRAVNVDGTNERILLTKRTPAFIYSPSWSPDGMIIACVVTDSVRNKAELLAFSIADKSERKIAVRSLSGIWGIEWLSDGSGLVMVGSDQPSEQDGQIWQVAYSSGKVERITNDLNDYNSISLTADSKTLVTTQSQIFSNIWVLQGFDASGGKQITLGNGEGWGLSWTPDNRIVYDSRSSGNQGIWIVEDNGTNPRQIIGDENLNYQPCVSPDGRFVVFVSDRSGSDNLWKVNIDGGAPKQLTRSSIDLNPVITPDGHWVIYSSLTSESWNLWKVSIDGGDPVKLTDRHAHVPAISPDGKLIAC